MNGTSEGDLLVLWKKSAFQILQISINVNNGPQVNISKVGFFSQNFQSQAIMKERILFS